MRNTPWMVVMFAAILAVGCGNESISGENGDVGVSDSGPDEADSSEADSSQADADPDAGENGGEDTDGDPNQGEESCGLAAPFDIGVEYERELFVDPAGSDSDGDGTDGAPFATLRRATDEATPGTRIVMREGQYAGGIYVSGLRGEPGRPVAVVGDGEVVIQGGANNIQFAEPSYLVVENLIFEGATANGLNIDDGGTLDTPAEYIVLRNLEVRGVDNTGNNDCIKLSGLRHFWVLDSEISACANGQGVDMVGCHQGVISGNRIGGMTGPGVQAKGGSSEVTIHGNWFQDISGRGINAGGSTSLPYFRPPDADHEARHIDTVANVFVDVGDESGAPIAFVGCDDCLFAHNTVIRPLTWVFRILQESTDERFVPARDGRVFHNVITLNVDDLRSGVYVNFSGGTDLGSFQFQRNLWYALDRDEYDGPTYDSQIPPEADSLIQEDPLFVDAAGQDFRLEPGSPAVGAGDRDLLTPWFPDYDGNCYGEQPTLGAFERDE